MSTSEHAPPPATDPGDTTSGPAATSSPRRGLWAQLRPLVLRLHFYAGVLIGPFILVAALTGLAYTITPQLENIVYADQLTVPVGTTEVPLSEQVAAARAVHPSGDILSITPPVADDSSTRVVFSDESVPTDYAMTVFVDPYTGQTLGQVQSYGQWLGVRAWLDELHRTLHLGDVGRFYSEIAASWLWVVVLGGLALWVGRRRARRRDLIIPEAKATGRARTRSWHAVTGTWVAIGLLALAASGLTWSKYAGERIGDIRSALDWRTPAVSTELGAGVGTDPTDDSGGQDHHGGMQMAGGDGMFTMGVGIDGVLAAAQAEGLQAPMDITPPAGADAAWTVSENKRSAPTRYDAISVDPMTGQVVDRVNFSDWPFMAKMTDWVIGAHMGILFGIVNQLLLAALAVGLLTVMVLGYRMWWQRRPTGGAVGRPMPRGSLLRRSPGALLIVVAVVAVSAWFVPLLGVTLALFLAVDVVLGARQRAGTSR